MMISLKTYTYTRFARVISELVNKNNNNSTKNQLKGTF